MCILQRFYFKLNAVAFLRDRAFCNLTILKILQANLVSRMGLYSQQMKNYATMLFEKRKVPWAIYKT